MNEIIVIGLGPGDKGQITLETLEILEKAEEVYVRTKEHPIVEHLEHRGIIFKSFDWVYQEEDNFDNVYHKITEILVDEANKKGKIVYAVPGHPCVAEKTVEILLKMVDNNEVSIKLKVFSSMSFIDSIITSVKKDPIEGLKIIDALDLEAQKPDPNCSNIITQVYDRYIASEVKLKLMELYDAEKNVYVVSRAGIKGQERKIEVPLYQLDRIDWIDYLTSIYIPAENNYCKRIESFDYLLDIMQKLRSPDGCPWDREQTHESLKSYLLEETYEVIDALDRGDLENFIEELGDILLQIVFHAQIGFEDNEFNIDDIVRSINTKMIYRHPHVFENIYANTADDAKKSWENMKKQEKGYTSYTEVMKNIPKAMPALIRAIKVQKKASSVGFDWSKPKLAIDKLIEEFYEFQEAYDSFSDEDIYEELGDIIFAIVNVARLTNIDPELALNNTTEKFINRFEYIEKSILKTGGTLEESSLEEMDKLWNDAKLHRNKKK